MSHQTVIISYIQTIPSFSYPHGDPGSLNLTVKNWPISYTFSFMTRRKDVQFGLSLFFFFFNQGMFFNQQLLVISLKSYFFKQLKIINMHLQPVSKCSQSTLFGNALL